MKKLMFFVLLMTGLHFKTYAQNDHQLAFSIGPELGLPSRSAFSIGYGASAKVDIPISGPVILSATGGYSSFDYKSGIVHITGTVPSATFVPLKAGIRYMAGMGTYLEVEGGDVIETNGQKRSLFAFSIGPGFLIRVNGVQCIDLGFRYENWSQHTLQQTAIRVAYRL